MTPEEAVECWCPLARAVIYQGPHPTAAEAYEQTRCIADKCMAWRWTRPPSKPVNASHKADGYCGLAGSHGLG